TMKKLENDRWCRTADKTEDHQKLIDALGVRVFPTGRTTSSGAHILKFCSTEGALDAPTRMICEMELTAKVQDKTYTIKHDVLLRSQPFRVAKDTAEGLRFDNADHHVTERLLHIQTQIRDYAMANLASLYNLIDRMIDGFDKRFGYDATQVANVERMWIGWIRGTFAGANGTPQGVTLADEIAAGYAFMQGLRDNTGILGRVAMGIMTVGYSEYVFSTMTLAEEMKKKVFECHGDEDFGFWDAVQMGVKEFSTQILLEVAMGGIKIDAKTPVLGKLGKEIKVPGFMEIGGEYMLKVHNIDMGKTVQMWAGRYRRAIDKADVWMKGNVPLYRMGDTALQTGKNFFNSSASTLSGRIRDAVNHSDTAKLRVEDKLQKARKNLTVEELADNKNYYQAMRDGEKEVDKLWKLQQDLNDALTDAKAYEKAAKAYKEQANVVMTNKNALKKLQKYPDANGIDMRKQFNEYREHLFDQVQDEALKDIAKELGCSEKELYVMNVSNGSRQSYWDGTKVPADRDITFKRIVHSDKTGKLDITIDQDMGQKAVARRLYKKMNGVEAESIEEALRFMKEKDVTYVNPNGFAKNADGTYNRYVFEHNLDGYEDLEGMVGMIADPNGSRSMIMNKDLMKNDLHNKVINQKSVLHKGAEWFDTDAKASLKKALELEAQAANTTGAARQSLLKQAREFRNASYGQTVEGVRQITKQVKNIVDARIMAREGLHLKDINSVAWELQELALRVGNDITPAEFTHILREDYSMDILGFADYMARLLD
ncbi:MAG: hypothetical protein IK078_09870, partial [Lachnospiraceae bacterium]|nr:hypothetical protein [Lachnospiraceae bacterium]